MRPIKRGTRPLDAASQPIAFSTYQQARKALIDRLGEYCSYCEMQLDASLAVEHVRPKKPPGAKRALRHRELDWNNFLLACTNCNSIKGDQDVVLADYVWPDQHDTYRALRYSVGGLVEPAPGRGRKKAENLIALVGLDRTPDTDEATDRRWRNRREAWDMAVRAKDRLARCPVDATQDMREQIIDTVQSKGFWSVWMTVFADDQVMRNRLLLACPGTNVELF